jgi:hypothetical protein
LGERHPAYGWAKGVAAEAGTPNRSPMSRSG